MNVRKRKRSRKPNSSDRLKKAQLSLYLEPKDYEALKALSARTGVPQQVYIRRGIDYILKLSSNGLLQAAGRNAQRRHRELRRNYLTAQTEWRPWDTKPIQQRAEMSGRRSKTWTEMAAEASDQAMAASLRSQGFNRTLRGMRTTS